MLSRSLLGLGALAACSFFAASTAEAHILLDDPAPMTDNDNAKQQPCGCVLGSADLPCSAAFETTTYAPGQQITVTFVETVDHAGEFRVAFSPKPPSEVTEEDFETSDIQVTIPDEQAGGLESVTITLPDTPCEECTIQLRQLMTGAPNPYYYSCASISIVEGAGPTGSGGAGGAPSGSGSGGAPGPTGSGGDGGNPVGGSSDDDGEPSAVPNPTSEGCSATGSSLAGAPGGVLVVAGLLLALSRRRRA